MKIKLTILLIFTFTVFFGQNEKYSDFLIDQKTSSKDYILNLFEQNDIVIICERAHPEKTQYDLFYKIISDKKFINQVGTVCTEAGLINLNEKTEEFLTQTYKSDIDRYSAVLDISRNLSFHPLWEKYNFTDFLLRINLLNDSLRDYNKINLRMIDVPFSWDKIKTHEDYLEFEKDFLFDRDSLMANNIIQVFEKVKKTERPKILVILNYRHAFGDFRYADGSKPDNTARYIIEAYPDKTANVLLNSFSYIKEHPSITFYSVKNGIWDSVFKETMTEDIGFNFKSSPFGNDRFDMFPYRPINATFSDVFTGFCFYKPLEKHKLLIGIPHILDNDFKDEYIRRLKIINPNIELNYERIKTLNQLNRFNYKTLKKYLED